MQPVTIENDAVAMEIWPQIGGKVSSIVDKADGFELLFTFPAELPDSPIYDSSYTDHWHAGWDECFPAVAAGRYPRHPYEGICIPDHGELWGIPVTTAVPTKDGITTVWHGLRFGYRLTRKLYLDGSGFVAEYSASNLSPFDFHFVWGMHPLMSLVVPVQLNAGPAHAFRLSHDAAGTVIDEPFDWPTGPAREKFDAPTHLPPRRGWKLFSSDPIQSPFMVNYPTRRRSVRIEFSSADSVPAYWGIWMNTGGWAGHRHFAIEPMTGRYDQLDRSMRDGSAGMLPGFGRKTWAVRWTLA